MPGILLNNLYLTGAMNSPPSTLTNLICVDTAVFLHIGLRNETDHLARRQKRLMQHTSIKPLFLPPCCGTFVTTARFVTRATKRAAMTVRFVINEVVTNRAGIAPFFPHGYQLVHLIVCVCMCVCSVCVCVCVCVCV